MKSDAKQDPNMNAIFAIADSPAGKRLLELMQQDTDPAVQTAIQQAQAGDYSRIQAILKKLMSMPETASLIQDIRGNRHE